LQDRQSIFTIALVVHVVHVEVFVIEVVVKLLLLSPRVYFTGTNYAWNIGAPKLVGCPS
jgi:hypothetical protein